jgi:DNA-directed RNA polymerase specialized sigma24 family protein
MGLPALETNGRSHDTEALYREHHAAVARLCRSLLRDRVEAEDATQQVFLAAHRALLNGSAPREPLAWLLAVARHECYARFRQRTSTPVPTGDVPDGSTPDASAQVLAPIRPPPLRPRRLLARTAPARAAETAAPAATESPSAIFSRRPPLPQ